MSKIHLIAMLVMLSAVTSFSAVGSRDIEQWESDNQGKIESVANTAEVLGTVLSPTTGGLSLVVVKIFSLLTAAFFGVNRTIAAHKRRRIIEEVDANPSTPSIAEQVSTLAVKASVNAMSGIS
jgi:hypothetical protein